MTPDEATAPPRTAAGADNRSRQARGDARRRQILDAAVELFARSGYQGTGVAALAEEVGMTAPGLLYYFGTKERLLREVVAERDRVELSDLASIEELTLASLRDLGRQNMAQATLTRLYVRLGAESLDATDPLHGFFAERYRAGRELIGDVLALDRDRGRIRAELDLERLAAEVLATLMGLEIQWLTDPDAFDLGDAVAAYVDRLVEELSP